MKLTNKYNLPQPIVDAVANDDYDRGDCDLSVTQLWKSPRIVELERQHADKITSDAIDNIWSLLGKAVHEILRRADTTAITEKRLFVEIDGYIISGAFDRMVLLDGLLQDYKVTSSWSVAKDLKDSDWAEQLNTYAYILRRHGVDIKALQVIAILRDWLKREAAKNPDYPQKQVETVDLPLWSDEKCEAALRERVALHKAAKEALPLCSDKDRWTRPPKIAVMKTGNKRAVKLFDDEGAATAWIAEQKDSGKLYLDKRAAQYVRCESYCGVAPFCSQYGGGNLALDSNAEEV